MWLLSLSVIVLSFACINNADNLFIFPNAPGPGQNYVGDLSWPIGSSQKIQWTSSIESYNITLWQQNLEENAAQGLASIYSIAKGGAGQQSFIWQVQTYNSQLSVSTVYFLWVTSASVANFTSHYFNITNQAQSSSSSSSSTASTSSTSSTASVTAILTSSTPPQTSSDTISTSSTPTSPPIASSSTESIKVGLGVGLGVGIPLVLIAGIWIGLRVVKQRRSPSIGTGSEVPLSQYPDNKYTSNSYPTNQSVDYTNQLHEAPGGNPEPYELLEQRNLVELGSREF